VNEGPKAVLFAVVPAEVKAGQEVTIVWSAAGASDVKVSDGTTDVGTGDTGTRPGGAAINAQATVTVKPVVKSFTAVPGAAMPGETINLSWETAGAEQVEISEDTFGTLTTTTTDVASGTFAFEVPFYQADAGVADPDAGIPVPPMTYSGMPLHFTLKATTATPAQTVTAGVDGRVGSGPSIDQFVAPAYATAGKPMPMSWRTTNAVRVELWAGGSRLYTTSTVDGSFTFPGITADTAFTLKAFDFTGLSAESSKTVMVAQAPSVTSFTADANVGTATSPVHCAWQTANASRVLVRVKDGPTLYSTDLANIVANGTADVYLGSTSTLVLEAWNLAGDKATMEATTTVATPTEIAITPNPTFGGDTVQASWDVTSLAPVDLLGMPAATPIVTAASSSFIDLTLEPTATELYFANPDDDVAAYPAPAGFRFPFLDLAVDTFYVSTNGFVALTPITNANNALSTNPDLADVGFSGPAALAPFWDDLDLTNGGKVLAMVQGTDYPRTLVIQWEKAAVYGQSPSELTFEVQISETGEFYYVYKTMQGTDADGAGASIGVVRAAGAFQASLSYNNPGAANEGDEQRWFGGSLASISGMMSFGVAQTTSVGFLVANASGDYVPVRGTVRVFNPGDLVVSEVMPLPNAAATMGKWVEILNPSSSPVDLGLLQLVSDSDPMAPYTFPPGTMIQPGEYLVVGQSTNMADNGEAPVDLAWGAAEVPLTDTDGITLQVLGTTPFAISSISWTPADLTEGSSLQPDAAIDTSGNALTCTHTMTFGTLMQVGTPGAANETCFNYSVTSIPVSFFDISTTGTRVPHTSTDDNTKTVDLGSDPVTVFGMQASSLAICTNGWIHPGSTTSTTYTNQTTPSTTSIIGTVAPFWDDLTISGGGVYYKRVAANEDPANPGAHWIVQFQHVTHLGAGDNLNFEVKFFDTGVIEYHYAAMSSGSSSNYGTGSSATVWLERPDGSAALPININDGLIRPNTGYRFTPAP